MSWITPTLADTLATLSAPEKSALQTAVLATGQSDPLAETLAQVVQEVRGYVAACKGNTLDADTGTIPAELKPDALAIVRFRAANRLNVRALLGENRVAEYKDAVRKLEMVAACRFAVEQPANLSSQVTTSGAGVTVVAKTTRTAGRSKLAGL